MPNPITPAHMQAPALLAATVNASYGRVVIDSFGVLDSARAEQQLNVASGAVSFRKNGPLDRGLSDPHWSPDGLAAAMGISGAAPPAAPVNSVAPVVSGATAVGSTLTCAQGTWTGSPTLIHQWRRSGANISGATGLTYLTVTADGGSSVDCLETATNAGGSASAASNAIAVAAAFTYPGAPLGLYSVRKVGAAYAGNCLKVQRSGDNATQDIGFNASGIVDMSAIATFWTGSPNSAAWVNTWYDQSGNARNLGFVSAGLPQINFVNGKPYVCFMVNGVGGASGGPILGTTVQLPNGSMNGDHTIGFVGQLQHNYVDFVVSQFDLSGGIGWFFDFGGGGSSATVGSAPGSFQYFTSGTAGSPLNDGGRYYGKTNRYATKRASNVGTIYVNGSSTKTGAAANNANSTAILSIGGARDSSFAFTGLIGEVFVYGSALVDTDRNAIDAAQASFFTDNGFATPYGGAHAVGFDYNGSITCGSILNYARTNTWTMFAVVQLFMFPVGFGNATVVYTNVPATGTAFPGHELWIDNFGKLRVRLMSDFGANNYIGVIGTTNVIDGKKHAIAYSYDGSSLAAGIKIYIDGVLETTTVEHDALTGAITGTGQSLYVGNQQSSGPSAFNLMGVLSHFQIDDVVRNQAYITANFTGGAVPPISSTDIRFIFDEGTGTTTADSSGNSHTGTLTTTTMWAP